MSQYEISLHDATEINRLKEQNDKISCGSAPWKVTAPFDEQRHLFYGAVATNYLIDGYVCSCGTQEFVIRHQDQESSFACKECGNQKFYDADLALNHIEHFNSLHPEIDLLSMYEIVSGEGISSQCVITLPTAIDFSSDKIIYAKKCVHNLSISENGFVEERYLLSQNSSIYKELEKKVLDDVKSNNNFNLPMPNDRQLSLNMISFFLKHRYFKEFDFYFWDDLVAFKDEDITIEKAIAQISNYRKEKSIKKAVYQNYLDQLLFTNKFYSLFIDLFTRHFTDYNIVVKLINLRFSDEILQKTDKQSIDMLLTFLKIHYTQKQICNLFIQIAHIKDEEFFYFDMINEFIYAQSETKEYFTKVTCNLETLHNEFIRCTINKRYATSYKTKLEYLDMDMHACTQSGIYTVKLPNDGKELAFWANILHNCMLGYLEKIVARQTIIYGFFIDERLIFSVEIVDGKIVQASKKYNTPLSNIENTVMQEWFHRHFDHKILLSAS